ncbi:hypothetical protein PHISCL_04406 [Aspergillus sclerotialis]|uniref:Clr5 domain-containing protein n=1 Tax=Aspergillus sclerotialis TaxID=2070753 RepID=A0A3A2ZJ22_9EURO|nr:hypothetical protein PHISCL_04406 [Aspergillus sclerotialis]
MGSPTQSSPTQSSPASKTSSSKIPSTKTTPNNKVFRPRRSSDWQEFRPIIEGLYRSRQLKLKDVKEIMEQEYKFVASEKQYKDRLAQWGIRKNIKSNEADIIHRKQLKRAALGKQTAVRVGGQPVSLSRIERIRKRNGATWESSLTDSKADRNDRSSSTEPATPSDMTCYTPDPEDKSSDTLSPTGDALSEPSTKLDILANGEYKNSRSQSTNSFTLTAPSSHSQSRHQPEQARKLMLGSGYESLAQYEETINNNVTKMEKGITPYLSEEQKRMKRP